MLLMLNATPYIPTYILEMGNKDMYVTMALRDLMGYCCDLVFGYISEYDIEGSRSFLIGTGIDPVVIEKFMDTVYNAVHQIFMSIPPYVRDAAQYRASADINMVITVTGGVGYVPKV